MKMLSIIGRFFLKVSGWRIKGKFPANIKKAVIICGPHTSNWDAFYSLSMFATCKININIAIKKEAMFFPLTILLKKFGAIAIDRCRCISKKTSVVDKVVGLMNNSNSFYFAISPEGTRKYTKIWKKGFYHIATTTNVPIIITYLDYKTKTGGFGPVFYPTGDIEKDILEIKDFYRDKEGKYFKNGIY